MHQALARVSKFLFFMQKNSQAYGAPDPETIDLGSVDPSLTHEFAKELYACKFSGNGVKNYGGRGSQLCYYVLKSHIY